MKKKLLVAAVFILVSGVFYFGVYKPKHTFNTTNSTLGNISVDIKGVGEVGSRNLYRVSSVFAGKVMHFRLNEGDFVRKGELIAGIDSIDLKKNIKAFEFNVKKLQADIESLKINIKSAKIKYGYQKSLYEKNKKLYLKRVISNIEYRKYETDEKTAKLTVEDIKQKISSLKNQIAQTKENIAALKSKLKRYDIYSPTDGYVTKKYIANGDVVNPGQPMADIINPKDVWVKAYIDTRFAGKIKINDKALIKLRSRKRTLSGYVANISPFDNSVTYEREIDVKFDKTPVPFYINEQAIVSIKIKTLKKANIIPSKLIVFKNGKSGVWIVSKGKAKFHPVTILARKGDAAAIKSILKNIIVPNRKKVSIKDGMRIYND